VNKIVILDIGCGPRRNGDIGLDVRKTKGVNFVADAHTLPFKDESFDKVASSEVIEHFSHLEVKTVVKEWVRVLKKGGTLEIDCPDLRARAFLFFINPDWRDVVNIYGGQDYETNYHKCGFSFGLLKVLLEECGIINIKRVVDGYKGIPFIPNCLHVKGIKG
jgi:predicted SAM-dependent methyltransferase